MTEPEGPTWGDILAEAEYQHEKGRKTWDQIAEELGVKGSTLRRKIAERTPGDPGRWARSTQPLNDEQYLAFRAYLVSELDKPGPVDKGVAYAAFLTWLGCHPIVLEAPDRFGFNLTGKEAIWRRPKTKRFVRVVLLPELRPRAQELLTNVNAWRLKRRRIAQLVARAGARAGVPGISPRCLRHTFVFRVMRETGNPYLAAQLGGVSPEVVLEYANYLDPAAVARLGERGF